MFSMKSLRNCWAVFLCLATLTLQAQHQLHDLEIIVNLFEDGSAYIGERRQMTLGDQGTEIYIKQYGLADSQMAISHYEVVEDTTRYEFVDWDINASRSEKAYRCGVNYTEKGVELCWGFGAPGEHVFNTFYLLSNLVQGYTDYDGFNHCFYDAANPPARHVQLTLSASDDSLRFSKENAGIWGFKFHGNVHFDDGSIVAESEQSMEDGDKMVLMVQFQKGLFHPQVNHDETFTERVKERAFIGSDYSADDEGTGQKTSLFGGDDMSLGELVFGWVTGIFVFVVCPLLYIFRKPIKRARQKHVVHKLLGNTDEVPYHREVPLNGQLLESQKILRSTLGIIDRSVSLGGKQLIEALLLRLIYKKAISLDQYSDQKGNMVELFRIADPTGFTGFDNDNQKDRQLEYSLHDVLYAAAGSDHLLQPNELKNYIKDENNTLAIRSLSKILTNATDNRVSVSLSSIDRDKAREVFGFWRYLNDFSLVGEREVAEVALWKDYLVYASLYGIAGKVRKGMKKMCPDYTTLDTLTRRFLDETDHSFDSLALLTNYAYNTILYSSRYETHSERLARQRFERWSGGGGSASFGGGGGFSGGGGSGVR